MLVITLDLDKEWRRWIRNWKLWCKECILKKQNKFLLWKTGLECLFPCKLSKISLQHGRFPSTVGWFPFCISLSFPPNHNILWQGAYLFPYFFQALFKDILSHSVKKMKVSLFFLSFFHFLFFFFFFFYMHLDWFLILNLWKKTFFSAEFCI